MPFSTQRFNSSDVVAVFFFSHVFDTCCCCLILAMKLFITGPKFLRKIFQELQQPDAAQAEPHGREAIQV